MGLSNRRLAAMLGDFVYETSSAEDESRRYLEMLYDEGKRVLAGSDLKSLEAFTSEHNRDQRRAEGIKEEYVSWGRVDGLSQKIIHALSQPPAAQDPISPRTRPRWIKCSLRRKPCAISEIRLRTAPRVMATGSCAFTVRTTVLSPRVTSGAGLR